MRCSARRPNPPEAPRLELKDALFDAEAEPTRIRPKAKHQISFFLPSCLASERSAQAAWRRGGVGRWDPRRGTSDPTHPTLQSRIRRRSEESTAGGPAPHPPRRSTDLGFSLATHSTSGVRGQSPRCATDFGKEIGIKKALFGAEAEPTRPNPPGEGGWNQRCALRRGGRTYWNEADPQEWSSNPTEASAELSRPRPAPPRRAIHPSPPLAGQPLQRSSRHGSDDEWGTAARDEPRTAPTRLQRTPGARTAAEASGPPRVPGQGTSCVSRGTLRARRHAPREAIEPL